MPLFVLISGYFSHKKDFNSYWKSCSKLFESLFFFQFIFLAKRVLSHEEITWELVFTPNWVLWYLLSLIYWRSLLQFLPDRILNKKYLVVASTFVVCLLSGFLNVGGFLSIQRTLAFLPFFFLGHYMSGKQIFLPSKYYPLCLCIIFISFFAVFLRSYMGDLTQSTPYDDVSGMLERGLVFVLCIPIAISFINICPTTIHWLSYQGKYTLQYYLYHSLLLPIFVKFVVHYNLPVSFIFIIIYTVLLIVVLFFMLKLPYVNELINPLSLLKSFKCRINQNNIKK